MLKLTDIALESPCGKYWVHNKGHQDGSKGYEIYKSGVTHSTRCAIIGYKGEEGLKRARQEIERRILEDEK